MSKITKLRINEFLGIEEIDLKPEGDIVVIEGRKGVGKTSIIDMIKAAFTNKSERSKLIKDGAKESEIYLETSNGIEINRKKRLEKADYNKVTQNKIDVQKPQEFLSTLFNSLQFDPVNGFYNLSDKEKNRELLSLVKINWSMDDIANWFGEIPTGENIDYSDHILNILESIAAKDGNYYLQRESVNREVKRLKAVVNDKKSKLPENYNADSWRNKKLSEQYEKIAEIDKHNQEIERAKMFVESIDDKLRGITANERIDVESLNRKYLAKEKDINDEISAIEKRLAVLQSEKNNLSEKKELELKNIESIYDAKKKDVNKLQSEKSEFLQGKEIIDVTSMREAVKHVEEMKSYIRQYDDMVLDEKQIDQLVSQSEQLTNKIETARNLPGELLSTSDLPIKGLSVENGKVLINNMPVENLSDGEKLELAIDIAYWKKGELDVMLIDGFEKLDTLSQDIVIKKLKDKQIQAFITKVSDSDLQVNYL